MSSAEYYTVQLLNAILKELQNNAKGEVWPATLTVPSNAVLTIDFEDGTTKLSAPNPQFTQAVEVPQAKLTSLTITNDGPNDIQYNTNKALNNSQANAVLHMNETINLDFKKPAIVRLNLIAIGGTSTCRVVGLI